METTAQIVVNLKPGVDGEPPKYQYDWIGPIDGVVGINLQYARLLGGLPWKLEMISTDSVLGMAYFRRVKEDEDGNNRETME